MKYDVREPGDPVSHVSAAVFKNKHQLEVLATVGELGEDGQVYARQVAAACPEVSENQVGPILKRLAGAGLLQHAAGSPGGGERIYYELVPSPLWELVAQLRAWARKGDGRREAEA